MGYISSPAGRRMEQVSGLHLLPQGTLRRMNTELIAQTWFVLGERQAAMIEAFYDRFFERFPDYRRLFPAERDPYLLQKMVETMSLVARLGENRPIIAPRLQGVGDHHQPYRLGEGDLRNFRDVFIEVLGEQCGPTWTEAAADSWRGAFDEVVIPLMMKGNER